MSPAALTPEERRTLLTLARGAIEHRARTGQSPVPEELRPRDLSARLREPRGAFVTIEERGQLRGCIGHLHPVLPLWEAVIENAINAGWHDPRFQQLRPEELPHLQIEISVIGPLEPIEGPDDFRIGPHGLLIEAEGRRGVLLPQVATERGWDGETFLAAVCRKAGLPADAWRRPSAALWRFEAEHFSERGGD